MKKEKAVFAAGCFWGVQSAFDAVPGVLSTVVGYTGGSVPHPDYETVCRTDTGHAEAVEIVYDADVLDYETLLDVFFASHDPTTKDRQGPDVGSQYRSAVFYLNEEQKTAALKKIAELEKSDVFENPVVTEVAAAGVFYPAEEYHQKYLQKQGRATCRVTLNKIASANDEEWQTKLTPEQYRVLRQKGTEAPFTGKYLNHTADGTYTCAACGNPVFLSEDKFLSPCGWPSFDKAVPGSVRLTPDFSHGMIRTEVTCARCGSHLGHVFDDGPTQTGERFCINSVSMDFKGK